MGVTENTFERYYDEISDVTEDFILDILERLRYLSERLIADPDNIIDTRKEIRRLNKKYQKYFESVNEMYSEEIERAYIRGVKSADSVAGDAEPEPGNFTDRRLLDVD